jgi:hypothetical protein
MIVTTNRGSKKHITSSFFKDISLLRASEVDTNYRQQYRERKNSSFDLDRLKLAYATQKLILFKKGCRELSEYVSKLNESQLKDITTNYIGSDYEEYDGPIEIPED